MFFAIGLMLSCSERDPAMLKLRDLEKIDVDTVEGLRHFVTRDFDESWKWTMKEAKEERAVYIHLDEKTGEYICKSIPKEKAPLLTDEEILRLAKEQGCLPDAK